MLDACLIQPASKWMHWATLRRHSCMSRAATSASSQVSVIFRRSFLSLDCAYRVSSWSTWSSLETWNLPV